MSQSALDNSWVIRACADVGHPNRLAFEGCLTVLDEPSNKAPSGARGHRVILTKAAAQNSLPTLVGMAVNYKIGWDGHDVRQKCGVITEAKIEGRKLLVEGFLFARDFPEIIKDFSDPKNPMGMSYDIATAHIDDMKAAIWTINKCTFTGAAILYAAKAAYHSTSFRLKGSNEEFGTIRSAQNPTGLVQDSTMVAASATRCFQHD